MSGEWDRAEVVQVYGSLRCARIMWQDYFRGTGAGINLYNVSFFIITRNCPLAPSQEIRKNRRVFNYNPSVFGHDCTEDMLKLFSEGGKNM